MSHPRRARALSWISEPQQALGASRHEWDKLQKAGSCSRGGACGRRGECLAEHEYAHACGGTEARQSAGEAPHLVLARRQFDGQVQRQHRCGLRQEFLRASDGRLHNERQGEVTRTGLRDVRQRARGRRVNRGDYAR